MVSALIIYTFFYFTNCLFIFVCWILLTIGFGYEKTHTDRKIYGIQTKFKWISTPIIINFDVYVFNFLLIGCMCEILRECGDFWSYTHWHRVKTLVQRVHY
jgi:hypothetical protein